MLALLLAAGVARADLAPPPRAKVTLELTVEGQASVPHLKLFVTNCNEEPEKSVLEPNAPLVCNPESGPVRVFGFREGDLIELFAKLENDAGREESARFLSQKAKTCGEVEEQDRAFEDVNVALVQARYSVEKRDKDSCRIRRISATRKTRQELQSERRTVRPAPPPAPSASPSPAPKPSSEVAVGGSSSCSCELAPARRGPGPSAWLGLGLAGIRLRRRRRGPYADRTPATGSRTSKHAPPRALRR